MKSIAKRIGSVGFAIALLAATLTPTVQGLRYYSDCAESFSELSEIVNQVDDGNTDSTVLIRTDGTKPDFRGFSTEYTIQGPDDLYVACFESDTEAEAAIETFNDMKGVLYAEPNYTVRAQSMNTTSGHSWGVDYLHTENFAQQLRESGQSLEEVTVAFVDSGIDDSHEIFDGHKVDGYSFVSEPYNLDPYNHGTCTAGVVADCTEDLPVNIFMVRVLNSEGKGKMTDTLAGIRYAADAHFPIINMSIVIDNGVCSNVLHDAISYAINRGSLMVIAAGNQRLNMDKRNGCPGHMPEPIVVSGCDSNGKAYFNTNFGSTIDLCAPALAVETAVSGGGYEKQNGTSFSAPYVSAVAALYKLNDPGADRNRLQVLLKRNVRDLGDAGKDSVFGYGVPDLSDVDLNSNKAVGAKITALPGKLEYIYREKIQIQGLIMTVTYGDGEEVAHSQDLEIRAPERLQVGENIIIVRFEDFTDTFTVHAKLAWWQWIIRIFLLGWIWY